MAADISLTRTNRIRPAEDDLCPVQAKSLRKDEETCFFRCHRKPLTGDEPPEEERTPVAGQEEAEASDSSEDNMGRLDIDLDRKSKQHNLTSHNVRAILHEVITHERVVAMMKAAIRETQDLPMFEPKMTRSRLKQAVQQGQTLNWRLSAISPVKPPQFVDIDLEEEDDSSDEEYCPDGEEEEEEDTVDETFLSDADSLASPPKIHLTLVPRVPAEPRTSEPLQTSPGLPTEQSVACTGAAQTLLTFPEPSFMDRLNAVEEELDCSPAYTYNQAPTVGGEEGCLAYRTRSKLRLVNIPLGQLEAELLAPDITADMYDQSGAQQEEDRHWAEWLQGLMAPDNEEEADDDDDPEYNVLEDLDEPDREDYRTDRAVQITKKEVNELLEELFDTLHEEVAAEEEEQEEQEEAAPKTGPKFNIPQALRFEAPLAGMLTERRRTVRKRYEAVQQRRALQDTTNHGYTHPNTVSSRSCPTLHLDRAQKLQLQQHIQQHVQLLTQVHLLSRRVDALKHQAGITRQYLEELQQFSCRREALRLPSSFRVCNLQGALDLIQEVQQREEPPPPAAPRRWLPRMTPVISSHAFPLLPADTAWLLATRPVFLYPELLPVCSLDPALHVRQHRSIYTAGEDGLIVLGLKHFEGTVQSDQLISSYLLCKKRWNFRKHVREMSSQRAPANVVKMFLTQRSLPPLPLACSRVQPGDQCPPVDSHVLNRPNWLKNSHQIIKKTRLDSGWYPSSLPPGCTLRLHPYWLNKSRAAAPPPPRLFTLAHNASLLPLAKAPEDMRVERQVQPVNYVSLPPGLGLHSDPPTLPTLTSVYPLLTPCFSIDQAVSRQQPSPLLPLPSLPTLTLAPANVKPGCLLQMVWTTPPDTSQQEVGPASTGPRQMEEESSASTSTLSPVSFTDERVDEENRTVVGVVTVSAEGGDGEGSKEENGGGGEGEELGGNGEDGGGEGEELGENGEDGGGEGEELGENEEDGGGEGEEDGEKDKDEDHDRQGEEEEEEDFDDLTQDEDEEEVMSSASEESVLSVPELQETMKQLTWLASEQRICPDGDSEDEHSPTSEDDEEDGGHKEATSGDRRRGKGEEDEETPSGEGTPRGGGGRCPGRGRGRSRPLRGLRRSRQERDSKDSTKLLLLYDEGLLDKDPHRESKDMAFAQSYLTRIRDALHDEPAQVEAFVSLLGEFERVGERQDVVPLFRKLRCILGERTDLLRDFAAFLHPEQALQCGLFEEQQAFERSRRFLRQLEISFSDNPSHYQKIIKALQTGPDLSHASILELKAQMALLLKGHTHLQAEFWVFFEELRPPPARPAQFEEAHWPEDGGGGSDGGEASGQVSLPGSSCGFEEVTLPELDEEEEGQKMQPMTGRRRMRKINACGNYKDCDWSDKDWLCTCRDGKIRRHRRKGCSRCHGNKSSGAVSKAMKSLDPLYQTSSSHIESGDKDLDLKRDDDSPQPDPSSASWDTVFHLVDEKEEEEDEELVEEDEDEDEEERKNSDKEQREETLRPSAFTTSSTSYSTTVTSYSTTDTPTVTSSTSYSTTDTPTVTSSISYSTTDTPTVTSSISYSTTDTPTVTSSTSYSTTDTPTVTSISYSTTDTPTVTSSTSYSTTDTPTVTSSTSYSTTDTPTVTSSTFSSSVTSNIFTPAASSLSSSSSSSPPRPSPPPDPPVCAKNISLTASGEKVILWTREADRVILTTCQQEGANQNTFQAVSVLLGNKTASEVSRRFRDLMRLFRTAARQVSSEDEAPPTDTAAANQDV